jgi:hypothetical protein
MTQDHDHMLPTASRRWRQLEDERTALRERIDALRATLADDGPDPGVDGEITELEQQLESVEEKLERIALAAEMERQQDA